MVKKAISAEEFMQQHQGRARASKLEPFKADILKLKNNGFTQAQILEFLALNQVHIGATALNSFIRSRLKQQPASALPKKSAIQKPSVQKGEQRIADGKGGYIPPKWATQKAEEDIF